MKIYINSDNEISIPITNDNSVVLYLNEYLEWMKLYVGTDGGDFDEDWVLTNGNVIDSVLQQKCLICFFEEEASR